MIFRSLLAAATITLSGAALAECVRPQPPALVDGATADIEAMVKTQQDVKSYQAQAESFRKCIQEEEMKDMEDGKVSEESQAARLAAHNGVVDEETALAESWNAQIRAFKARETAE